MPIPSPAQIATLTLVAESDNFIVGSPHTAEYVEVPELGATIIGWLQQGMDLAECERRAAELAGEPVDVVDFLTVLTDEGLFAETTSDESAGRIARRWGTLLFHPAAWAAYAVLSLTGVVLLIVDPQLRPRIATGSRSRRSCSTSSR